jgi:hypothetical protein
MIDHCANDIVDSRPRMMLPLAIFGVACFLFAGAVKFHLKGGDIWFARPMGAPATCMLIGFAGYLAARWFFGAAPERVPVKVLAALVVALPIMGLFGVIEAATQGSSAPTPLGGTLGAMLAGPSAFGSLGTTAAGIVFAVLALFGGYLARRITKSDAPAGHDDTYTMMKAMNARRAAEPAFAGGGVQVAEEDEVEEAAADDQHAGLFPTDAEIEPEPAVESTIEYVRPMATLSDEEGIEVEAERAPVRAPLLSGIVAADAADDEDDHTPIFAATLREPEDDAPVGLSLDDVDAPPEPSTFDDERTPIFVRPPDVEPDEESGAEIDQDDDATIDDAEVEAAIEPAAEDGMTGETPELKPEWLAAPSEFHTPRRMEQEAAAAGSLFDILDVERELETNDDPKPETETPRIERPRFRVKAEYAREEPIVEAVPAAEAEPAPLLAGGVDLGDAEAPVETVQSPIEVVETQVEITSPIEEPTAAPILVDSNPTEHPDAPAAEPAQEAQLLFPVEGAPSAETEDEDADSTRPRRRMRSAKKDWASWDEAPKERPRLRLVRAEEPEVMQTEIVADLPAGQTDDAYERAVALVAREDRCSVSLLQRNLGVTFGEATALIDRMYQQGVVGPYQPTGRREVLIGKKGAAAEEGA